MSSRTTGGRPPFVVGVVTGLVTWALGYAIVYATIASEVSDSSLQRIIEFVDGSPATYEMVGWTFYNAHFVNTVTDAPVFGGATSFVGGQDGFSLILYAAPAGLLLAAGIGVARYRGARDAEEGGLAGLTVLPGYLLLSVVGIFLFELTLPGVTVRPEPVSAVFLAGFVFPLLFAGGGGAMAGLTGR